MMSSVLYLMDLNFMVKALCALVIGFALGVEREYRFKPAGLKTYAMICLGATIFTHISMNMDDTADPSRISAQIVSGLGFIGAGAIFQSKHFISGLTTAATLWVVGALGVLVGMEWYQEAFYSILLIFIYFSLSRFVQGFAFRKLRFNVEITVGKKEDIAILTTWFREEEITLLRRSWFKKESIYKLEIAYLEKKSVHQRVMVSMQSNPLVIGVRS